MLFRSGGPTLSPLETHPSVGYPGHTGGARRPLPLWEGGTSLTCLAGVAPPSCRAVAAAGLDTAPSVLARRLAYCCGWVGRPVTNSGGSPGPRRGGSQGRGAVPETLAQVSRDKQLVLGPGSGERGGPLPRWVPL